MNRGVIGMPGTVVLYSVILWDCTLWCNVKTQTKALASISIGLALQTEESFIKLKMEQKY